MNYQEWSSWVDGLKERRQQSGCVYRMGYYFGLLFFSAFKGFMYALGAWLFLKMIGVTI